MDKKTQKIVTIGAVAASVVVLYMWFKKYRDNKKVNDLKDAELMAANTNTMPSTATPPLVPTSSFVNEPMVDFINQPSYSL